MIVPRFTGQLERAKVSEAANMLGVIAQAQHAYRNGIAGVYLSINVDSTAGAGLIECRNAENFNAWTTLSLGDPNAIPNSFFTYCVDTVDNAVIPPTFRVVARRRGAPADPYYENEITLNQDGIWGGDHPFAPENLS